MPGKVYSSLMEDIAKLEDGELKRTVGASVRKFVVSLAGDNVKYKPLTTGNKVGVEEIERVASLACTDNEHATVWRTVFLKYMAIVMCRIDKHSRNEVRQNNWLRRLTLENVTSETQQWYKDICKDTVVTFDYYRTGAHPESLFYFDTVKECFIATLTHMHEKK